MRQVRGEAASNTNELEIIDGRQQLKSLNNHYDPSNVYNLDETAYFYCQETTHTIAKRGLKGRKQSKKRITLAVAVNADGSDKRDLKFIGHSAKPRWFGKMTASELQYDYVSSKKGWMTSSLFRDWLRAFNEDLVGQEQKVLLLVDNAPPHRVHEELSNVDLRFLPPNTTAYLQPLDGGIIAAMKKRIRQLRTKYFVDKFDSLLNLHKLQGTRPTKSEVAKLHVVDMKSAMDWAKVAWNEVKTSTVTNCWRHTDILGRDLLDITSGTQSLQLETMVIEFNV
ncbi:hypothetical protein LEN26_002974 [Aphanomyces euteiches]|nr:hypothetical protein LEN26_002974 [Aphanomyces euteiches]